jgi:predicted HTH transcriptional regulator
LKTICGFANNKGGVIVFGVAPVKLELVGIQDKFENLDNKYLSTTFSDTIDGSFDYRFFTCRIEMKLIGFFL